VSELIVSRGFAVNKRGLIARRPILFQLPHSATGLPATQASGCSSVAIGTMITAADAKNCAFPKSARLFFNYAGDLS
jgi:hypothetical protein